MRIQTSLIVFVVITMIGLLAPSTSAQELPAWPSPSQEISRADKKLEVFGILGFLGGDSEVDISGTITADFDDGIQGGIGIGTNLDDHLNLNFDAIFGGTDLVGSAGPISTLSEAELFTLLVNLDYNVFKTRLTPMLTAGVGLTILDGGFVGGGPGFKEEDFSYSFGAGLRWDVTDRYFLKFLYRRVWTELEGFDSPHEFDTINFYIGVTY